MKNKYGTSFLAQVWLILVSIHEAAGCLWHQHPELSHHI
uniref:Uncharacterized protein n=1 Tax=Arundo donax TaxID=35708 RepID=A0A0A9EX08_ARUDO